MENIITIIVSATVSGVLATFITLWWQNRSEKMKIRKEVFETLMGEEVEARRKFIEENAQYVENLDV